MRKYFVVLILCLVAATAWAAGDSFTDYKGVQSVYGYPGPTLTVYVDNGARTIQSTYERAGGTWVGGQMGSASPIGMYITCATTVTKWAFGGATPSATLGHPLAAATNWYFVNPFWMSTGKSYGNAASDNVTCQMTPVY
jgi:hypothetical protein